MKVWKISEQEVSRDIMSTDVFVKIISDRHTQEEMDVDVSRAFDQFRDFERHMSRFLPESEVSQLNHSEGGVVSKELFDLLTQCKKYHSETQGIFDPSILTHLKREGYGASFLSDQFGRGKQKQETEERYVFVDVVLDEARLSVQKPLGLEIDLGGIGKGFIVDQVVDRLGKKYENVFVYAGGDISVRGVDKENGYSYWASDIENPVDDAYVISTVLLKDCAVATSGTNRRKWRVGAEERHHLIDPRLGRPAKTDIVSVTVIEETAERADVWAKTLCILGLQEGMARACERGIPAIFVDTFGKVRYTESMPEYLWEG